MIIMLSTESIDILEVQNLNKMFTSGLLFTKEIYALNDVSFSLQKGEILSIVGESGSGKSTTANIILRLIKPTSGRVLLDTNDIQEFLKRTIINMCKLFFKIRLEAIIYFTRLIECFI